VLISSLCIRPFSLLSLYYYILPFFIESFAYIRWWMTLLSLSFNLYYLRNRLEDPRVNFSNLQPFSSWLTRFRIFSTLRLSSPFLFSLTVVCVVVSSDLHRCREVTWEGRVWTRWVGEKSDFLRRTYWVWSFIRLSFAPTASSTTIGLYLRTHCAWESMAKELLSLTSP